MTESGDNVRLKKILHELKTSFPALPDEVIRDCVKQCGNDIVNCQRMLFEATERYLSLHGGPAYKRITSPPPRDEHSRQTRRLSLKALLDQQMRRHLMLKDEYDKEVQHLKNLRDENSMLETTVGIRKECIRSEIKPEKHDALKEEVQSLEGSCSDLRIRISSIKDAIFRNPDKTEGDSYQQDATTEPSALSSPIGATVKAAFVNLASPGLSPSEEELRKLPQDVEEEEMWACSQCTLDNHAALKSCEACEMPRFMVGTNLTIVHPDSPCVCHPQEIKQPGDSSGGKVTRNKNFTSIESPRI